MTSRSDGLLLPPPPWAVREYFERRRLADFGRGYGAEELADNDRLWLATVVPGRHL